MDNWSSHPHACCLSIGLGYVAKTLFQYMPLSSSEWFNSSLLRFSGFWNYHTLQPGYVDHGDSFSRHLLITYSAMCIVLGTK